MQHQYFGFKNFVTSRANQELALNKKRKPKFVYSAIKGKLSRVKENICSLAGIKQDGCIKIE